MSTQLPLYLALVLLIVLIHMVARRLEVAYPVLLVVAGLALSFVPGMPVLHIDPELIFLLILPPLLFEAAWSISWKELWRWRRIIGSFAGVVVLFSALSVALVAEWLIPGFSLALGFLLGAIVSPPDAVSAEAILRFVRVPRRTRNILEGESLLNDASSLLIFRFALVAVSTGHFFWQNAALSFGWMLASGVGVGVGLGWVFLQLHKRLPTDSNADIVISLVTPFTLYLAAEYAHSSGVLAVVSGGLYLSNRRHIFLSSASRVRGISVWESLAFLLNGIVFMLIGLDLPEIAAGLGDTSLAAAIGYGLLISGVLIAGRFIAAFAAVAVTLVARNFITVADGRNPGISAPILLGWTGMRGVVSLAAALSVPVYVSEGVAFPQRNLILFITFIVILVTLLLQGLTLPALIRRLNLPDYDATHTEEEVNRYIRQHLARRALETLRQDFTPELAAEPALQALERHWAGEHHASGQALSPAAGHVYRRILEAQRHWLIETNHAKLLLDEEIIRKHMLLLDLEEEKVRLE